MQYTVDPGAATPEDVKTYRQNLLVQSYASGTSEVELALLFRAARHLDKDGPLRESRHPGPVR